MQTFAVLLNGALAGSRTGTASTILYVILVCLGAPFGAGGKKKKILFGKRERS
jgi:biotin transporter BioY